jgi:hypothetical protein
VDKFNPEHQTRLKGALFLHAVLFMREPKKELDDARVLLYWKQLEQFDIEVIEQAAFKLQGKLRKFPLPVDLVEACEAVVAKKTEGTFRPNPRPPGTVAWCDEGCDDTGWIEVRKPLRELRPDMFTADQVEGDQMGTAVRKCACWDINPVKRWRNQENKAGNVRREEKSENNWSPSRRGQLVQFRGGRG